MLRKNFPHRKEQRRADAQARQAEHATTCNYCTEPAIGTSKDAGGIRRPTCAVHRGVGFVPKARA